MDPDQTAHFVVSDQGLHYLLRPVCPNIQDYYGTGSLQKNAVW